MRTVVQVTCSSAARRTQKSCDSHLCAEESFGMNDAHLCADEQIYVHLCAGSLDRGEFRDGASGVKKEPVRQATDSRRYPVRRTKKYVELFLD